MTGRLLSCVLLLGILLGTSGCTPLSADRIRITALLADSAGLFVGNDVGILGVPVGEVTGIVPDGTRVRVTLEIDAGQPVPADAGAVVVARSVATDRYVELTPVYRSGPTMADGAVIEQERTRTPVDFDTVLEALHGLANGLAGKGRTAQAVARVVREGSRALDGNGAAFHRAVTSLSQAVSGLSGHRGDITATLESLDALTGTLAANQQTVRTFVDQVALASELLAEERLNFRSAMRSLSEAVELVARFAKDNRHRLSTSLERSTAVMRSLLEHRGELEEILRVMPLSLQNVQRSYVDGRIRVALDPTLLTPLGGIVETLCTTMPFPQETCSVIGPEITDLDAILGPVTGPGGLLGDVLGGAR